MTADPLQWGGSGGHASWGWGWRTRAARPELRHSWAGLLANSGQAGYIICVAQRKMKCGPLVQKQGKSMKQGTKIEYFSPSAASPSTHGVFYLRCNIALGEEKLNFQIISMNFTTHLHIVQCQF